jgi:ribosome-associated heat shock protein Hsp15
VTRIDKYLWAVRLFKTRSQAAEQVKNGKITVNNEPVKAAKEIKPGDIIRIKKNTAQFSYKVIALLENRVGAPLVKNYMEDVTPESEVEKYKEYQLAQRDYRDFSFGKPSKSDRRKRDKFLGDT